MLDISDNDDEAVALLKQIARNTGNIDDGPDKTTNVDISGQTADGRVGLIPSKSLLTLETDNLEADKHPLTAGGTVELEPGDSQTLVQYDLQRPGAIYALGAVDESDVEYELKVDNDPVGGRTNSPLGVLNSPFSFVSNFGGAVPIEGKARYIAHYSSDSSGTIELAARMFVEVMG